jgi:hypothetical protein
VLGIKTKHVSFSRHSRINFAFCFSCHSLNHCDIGNVYLLVLSKATGSTLQTAQSLWLWLWQGKLCTNPLLQSGFIHFLLIKSSTQHLVSGKVGYFFFLSFYYFPFFLGNRVRQQKIPESGFKIFRQKVLPTQFCYKLGKLWFPGRVASQIELFLKSF